MARDAAGAAGNLLRFADLYEADIQCTLRVLIHQVEPALMILIGLWTGLVAWALYAPIFNLVDVIK
jgi:type II secretory pathway component PulF